MAALPPDLFVAADAPVGRLVDGRGPKLPEEVDGRLVDGRGPKLPEEVDGRLVDGRGPKLPEEVDAVGRLNDGLGNLAPLLELLAVGAGL